MICPKCGFSQPDDIYCASCGVNVDKYVQKRKTRRFRVGIIIGLICIAAISIAKFATTPDNTAKLEISKKDQLKGDKAALDKSPQDVSKKQRAVPGDANYPQRSKMARRPQIGSGSKPVEPSPPDQNLSRKRETLERSGPEERTPQAEPTSEPKEMTLSAREWFEKGRSLDNDSDAEIQHYQKAIEQDPNFAPPYYRLGAIYFRQADYDRAEQEFVQFLQHASEAEKQAYNLDLYYPSDYLERLLEEQKEEQPTPEEAEKELAAGEETESAEQAGLETVTETSQEIETILRFSTSNGQMVVPVLLNGSVNASLLFDTGAQITVLSRELAQSVGLEDQRGRAIELKTIASEIQGEVVTLDSILVGNLSRTDFPVAVVDLSSDQKERFEGILGMDFLGNYTIRIDNEAGRIALTPRRGGSQ